MLPKGDRAGPGKHGPRRTNGTKADTEGRRSPRPGGGEAGRAYLPVSLGIFQLGPVAPEPGRTAHPWTTADAGNSGPSETLALCTAASTSRT